MGKRGVTLEVKVHELSILFHLQPSPSISSVPFLLSILVQSHILPLYCLVVWRYLMPVGLLETSSLTTHNPYDAGISLTPYIFLLTRLFTVSHSAIEFSQ
jgi:hypothetical protein